MFRTRSVAVLASIALAAAGVLTSGGGSAAHQEEPGVLRLPVVEPAPGKGFIVGLVQDGSGYLDNVDVTAVGPERGSAQTYASDIAGDPQHGFYRLQLEPGRYRLTFERNGYVDERLTARVRVVLGDTTEAPTVTLARPSRSSAGLKDNRITPAQRAKVTVLVSSRATPTGTVTVRNGRRVVESAKLRKADDGTVTVTLPKLGKGTYVLKAFYAGSATVAPSSAPGVKLTVEKPRKHRPVTAHRPNIR